jgi:branched-chain amino acid transport system substrate-binding protein
LAERVFVVVDGHANVPNAVSQVAEADFRAKTGLSIWYPRAFNEMTMLAEAIKQTNSVEPKVIAAKLEGMQITTYTGGQAYMRGDDHQLIQDMYIASFGPLGANDKFDEESTTWGWRTIIRIPAKDTELPTTCKMERPS